MKAIIRCLALCLATSSGAQAVVLGVDDTLNTYSSVGYVATTGGGFGSVVALTPNWVLTAAHVVEDAPALMVMGDAFTPGAEGIYIFFDEVITHPGYVPGQFRDDLALIRLSDADPIVPGVVDVSFATLSNIDLDAAPLPLTATITGFGVTDIDAGIDPNDPLVRRFGIANTDPTGPPDPGFTLDFEHDCSLPMILCTRNLPDGSGGLDGAGGAPGDSGSAMFLDYGSGEVVAGINSYIFDEADLVDPAGTPNWVDGYWTVSTSTAYYEDWILGIVPDAVFGGGPVIPVPAAVWLFGSGLIVLAGAGLRRKRQ